MNTTNMSNTDKNLQNYIASNPHIFEYLNDFFKHNNALELIKDALIEINRLFPYYSDIMLRDMIVKQFYYNHKRWLQSDIIRYFSRLVAFQRHIIKDEKQSVVLNSESLIDLMEFYASFIYNNLIVFEQYRNSTEYDHYYCEYAEHFDFYPLARNRYSLGQYYWFTGTVKKVKKINIDQNNSFAIINIEDTTRKEFPAIVSPENYSKILRGINYMLNCPINIYGIIQNDGKPNEQVLFVERFVITKRKQFHEYSIS